jgi:hypothetical protein
MSYNKKVLDEESRILAIDFDGVIHTNQYGFHDGTIYGTPIAGSLESIKELANSYDLVIYTAKAKKDRPLVNGKTGTELVWEWLKKYNIDIYIKNVTAEKPRCICYIDDKAIRFVDWHQTMINLKQIIK